ncbi:uncharacterized membrane protein YcaP (DUF421 family) [Gracilibacillus halotolerans]|uniref:Uncharacterized membrane protein YcaP (DUF421 family) n=1 Tax=Gracilibacillus halotolerans TaxID=74386 RepID=A0A841RMX4_9BACI|nr:uncharacterized membrane protein YcaP (DUF421 family) [Gracilibacillus halotolerans]
MKEDKQPVVKKDMNVSVSQKIYPIPTEVISDGKIVKKNLTKLDLDEAWLLHELKQQNISHVKEVIFAQVQTDGTLVTYVKDQMEA